MGICAGTEAILSPPVCKITAGFKLGLLGSKTEDF